MRDYAFGIVRVLHGHDWNVTVSLSLFQPLRRKRDQFSIWSSALSNSCTCNKWRRFLSFLDLDPFPLSPRSPVDSRPLDISRFDDEWMGEEILYPFHSWWQQQPQFELSYYFVCDECVDKLNSDNHRLEQDRKEARSSSVCVEFLFQSVTRVSLSLRWRMGKQKKK